MCCTRMLLARSIHRYLNVHINEELCAVPPDLEMHQTWLCLVRLSIHVCARGRLAVQLQR